MIKIKLKYYNLHTNTHLKISFSSIAFHHMRISLILFVIVIMSALPAVSQTVNLSSLEEVLLKAVKNNPRQVVYQQRIQQSIYNHKASKGLLLPNASGTFSGNNNLSLGVTPVPGELVGRPGTTFYAQFGQKYNYNLGFDVSQSLFNWQSVLGIKIAQKNIDLSKTTQASFVQNLKEEVARIYLTTLLAKRSLDIANKDEILADSLVMLAKQRFQEGTTDMIALSTSLVNYNNIKKNKAKSQRLYDHGVESLKLLLGEDPLCNLEFSEDIKSNRSADFLNPDLGEDHRLDVYKEQYLLTDLQSKYQRAVAYPKLFVSTYIGAQQYRNDFGLSLNNNAWSGYRYLGVNLFVPIFTGFANSNKYKSSIVEKDIARQQYTIAQLESEMNDRVNIKNFENSHLVMQASEENFVLYTRILHLNRQKCEEGLISMEAFLKIFLEYLDAENTYLNDLGQLFSFKAVLISRQ